MRGDSLSISRELAQSAKWSVVATTVRHLCALMTIVLLARFVSPSDFGKAAIVISVHAFVLLLGQFGFAQAIVGMRDVSKRLIDSIFVISFALAGVLYVLVLLIAQPVADFYQSAELRDMLFVLGIGLFITTLGAVPTALLQRQLNYRGQALVNVLTGLASLATVAPLAVYGAGVWALILPSLAGGLAGGVAAFIVAGYAPSWVLDWNEIKSSMNFGISALVSNIANFICNNAIPLVMGKIWTVATLGMFKFASSSQQRLFDFVTTLVAANVFPIFSKVAHDMARLQAAFLRLTRLSLYIMLPMHMLLIIAARDLFALFFGPQWDHAVLPFQILVFVSLVRCFNLASNATLYALRRPDISAKVVIVRLVAYVAIIAMAYKVSAGLIQTLIVVSIAEVVVIALYLIAALKQMQCPISTFFKYIVSPAAATLILALMVFGTIHGLRLAQHGSLASLVVIALIGAIYAIMSLRWQPELAELFRRRKVLLKDR